MMKKMTLKLTDSSGIFYLAEEWCRRAVENNSSWVNDLAEKYTKLAASLEHSGWKRSTGMTQTQRILNHIERTGSISQREAYIDYGVQSFHRRLTDLREQGHNLVGHLRYHPTTGQRYTRYSLGK
tara:strand:+ start:3143 stop:3517 length:375 start_codon:yes stop_codon:yes gene_type:complete